MNKRSRQPQKTIGSDTGSGDATAREHRKNASPGLSAIKRLPAPGPKQDSDLSVAERVGSLPGEPLTGSDRLSFDGYKLRWHGATPRSWTAFSGAADESLDESVKNLGPTPQGLYAIESKDIRKLVPSDDWGSHRVKIEPYRTTLDRMTSCFKAVRTDMYVHGGTALGTHGCIELNADADETEFFQLLEDYKQRIELEVRYVGEREERYECQKCPYP